MFIAAGDLKPSAPQLLLLHLMDILEDNNIVRVCDFWSLLADDFPHIDELGPPEKQAVLWLVAALQAAHTPPCMHGVLPPSRGRPRERRMQQERNPAVIKARRG